MRTCTCLQAIGRSHRQEVHAQTEPTDGVIRVQMLIRHLTATRLQRLTPDPNHTSANLASMVMPLPAHLRPASPVSKAQGSVDQHPRSPIKKHIREAAATVGAAQQSVQSPHKLKAPSAVRVNASAGQMTSDEVVPVQTSSHLRAAMLQSVLSLMDRDDVSLQQLLPLLDHLAALPLDMENVRQRCVAAFQRIHTETLSPSSSSSSSSSSPGADGSKRVQEVGTARSRNSGRAKSAVSLGHCKQFLLACANEIHELEEVNPCFDYVEETASEAGAPPSSSHRQRAATRTPWLFASFDYASTVQSTNGAGDEGEDDDEEEDDTHADQGSQLSELLFRTVEVEKTDRDMTKAAPNTMMMTKQSKPKKLASSFVDRATCRRAFRQWRDHASSSTTGTGRHHRGGQLTTTDVGQVATMFHAFAALKRHRAASKLSLGRKQKVFKHMKMLMVGQQQQQQQQPRVMDQARTSTLVVATSQPSWRGALQRLVVVHSDFVVLLLLACVVHVLTQ